MFIVWQSLLPRPTRDIDLLGRLDNSVEHVVSAIQAICQEPATKDGLRFAAESVLGERIIEAADYEGVRVRFTAYLGTARIPMQIDVGFGAPLVPGPPSSGCRPSWISLRLNCRATVAKVRLPKNYRSWSTWGRSTAG
jgi:hypothetical protein